MPSVELLERTDQPPELAPLARATPRRTIVALMAASGLVAGTRERRGSRAVRRGWLERATGVGPERRSGYGGWPPPAGHRSHAGPHRGVVEITVEETVSSANSGTFPGRRRDRDGAGKRIRDRPERRHRHQRPRDRGGRQDHGAPAGWNCRDRHRHRLGPLQRPRRRQDPRRAEASPSTDARYLRLVAAGRTGPRARFAVRIRRLRNVRHRVGARPRDRVAERVHPHRRDPDRRGREPRQLRRATASTRAAGSSGSTTRSRTRESMRTSVSPSRCRSTRATGTPSTSCALPERSRMPGWGSRA